MKKRSKIYLPKAKDSKAYRAYVTSWDGIYKPFTRRRNNGYLLAWNPD